MIIEKILPYKMFHLDGFWNKTEIHSYILFDYINNGLAFMKNNFIGSITSDNEKLSKKILDQITKIFLIHINPHYALIDRCCQKALLI